MGNVPRDRVPSILDRLIAGPAPEPDDRRSGVDELRRSVLRDLGWLLNARSAVMVLGAGAPGRCDLARSSLLGYGLPEWVRHSRARPADVAQIAASLRSAIQNYEPRLCADTVRVEAVAGADSATEPLRFRIDATLQVHPVRVRVAFDTEVSGDGAFELEEVT
jgi:type VI secretion system protein ImpF